MKPIRLLCSISLLFISFTANAQTFFKDSTVWYVVRHSPVLLPPAYSFESVYKEAIRLDSISGGNEFYSVTRRPFSFNMQAADSLNYRLRVSDSVVYFTGEIQMLYDSFQTFTDLKLFDFKLDINDTIEIKVPGWSLCRYAIDSITFDPPGKPVSSKKYYYSKQINSGPCKYSFWPSGCAMSGIGFNTGLLPLPINWISIYGNAGDVFDLISACHNSELIYADSTNDFYEYDGFTAFCDEDSLAAFAVRIAQYEGIEEIETSIVSIYPNPANQEINMIFPENQPFNWEIQLTDAMGRSAAAIQASSFRHALSTAHLPPGIYFIQVQNLKTNYYEAHKVVVQH